MCLRKAAVKYVNSSVLAAIDDNNLSILLTDPCDPCRLNWIMFFLIDICPFTIVVHKDHAEVWCSPIMLGEF